MTKRRTPGHRMTRIGVGTWCACGHYLAGLGMHGQALGARDRFALHKIRIMAAQDAQR